MSENAPPHPVIEVSEVTMLDPRHWLLAGCDIQRPSPGGTVASNALVITGWVMGRTSPAREVTVLHQGVLQAVSPVLRKLPNLPSRYPDIPHAGRAGFTVAVGMIGLAERFELILEATLATGAKVRFASIRGTQRPAPVTQSPLLNPLLVTSLGRTGTTWLMRLLAEHPDIIVHRTHPYETRAAVYWLHTVKVLCDPVDDPSTKDTFWRQVRHLSRHPVFGRPVGEPEVFSWFTTKYVERVKAFALQSIDAFYSEVGRLQGEGGTYFAEKCVPGHIPWTAWQVYPDPREVLLVRDPRDVLCSMKAFDGRRGYSSFISEDATVGETVESLATDFEGLWAAWETRRERAHLVRYEDLIANPVGALRGLLGYADLDSSDAVAEEMVARASGPDSALAEHRTSTSALKSIGRWREDLDEETKIVLAERLGGLLERMGYDGASADQSGAAHLATVQAER